MDQKPSKTIDILFCVVLVIVPLLSIPWHEGILGCDPSTYIHSAKKIIEARSIDYNQLFETRVTAWAPYALYLLVFGINKYITWVTLLELEILLCIIYFFMRKHEQAVGFYATALLGLSTSIIQIGSGVGGDMVFALFVNLPLLVYWRFIEKEESPKKIKCGVIAGICWVLAFYAKESAVFYLVPCIWFTFTAGRNDKDKLTFWLSFWKVLTGAGILTAVYFYFQTGDPLRKLTLAHEAVTYYDTTSPEKIWNTTGELLYRLTVQPVEFLIRDYTFGIILLVALPFLIKGHGFWRSCSIILIAMWWWFPQGWNPYHPLWLIYRLWMPILLPMSIVAGYFLHKLAHGHDIGWAKWIPVAGGIGACAVSCLFYKNGGHDATPHYRNMISYAAVALFFLIAFTIRENAILPDVKKMMFFIIIIPFFYSHHDKFFYADKVSEQEEMEGVIEILKSKGADKIIVSYCFREFYKIYGDSHVSALIYDEARDTNTQNTFLVVDKLLVQKRQSPEESRVFKEISSSLNTIEADPGRFGFVPVDSVGNFEIYHHN